MPRLRRPEIPHQAGETLHSDGNWKVGAVMNATRAADVSSDRGTRDRILFESAELIAQRGYQATTTRDIAEAVGIKQPSLFHHFPSKAAIVEALLDWDLGDAVPRVKRIAETDAPASVRLYAYLQGDVNHLATSRFNLSGVYADQVISRPEFSRWAALPGRLHAAVEAIVREGTATGEFVADRCSTGSRCNRQHPDRCAHSAQWPSSPQRGLGTPRSLTFSFERGLLGRPDDIARR